MNATDARRNVNGPHQHPASAGRRRRQARSSGGPRSEDARTSASSFQPLLSRALRSSGVVCSLPSRARDFFFLQIQSHILYQHMHWFGWWCYASSLQICHAEMEKCGIRTNVIPRKRNPSRNWSRKCSQHMVKVEHFYCSGAQTFSNSASFLYPKNVEVAVSAAPRQRRASRRARSSAPACPNLNDLNRLHQKRSNSFQDVLIDFVVDK